ncbi:unnamed protein product [Eruca vesicaria subsp. sativa]|uniref:Uncharacterized protein n=1 Tax=Eruca vesicaria subsp. sativa TaxID=29727 RepID=A0ABC8K795_ERUVS|nr:unnamed protein product [Eruca vesicaria subsp. sativa]
MGLECLPRPNVMEPRANSDIDPYFLRSSWQTNTFDVNTNHLSDVSCDHLDSRTTSKGPRKRMIERFQTETLPPRTAKPISVIHIPFRIRDLKEKLEAAAEKASTSCPHVSNNGNSKYLKRDQNEKNSRLKHGSLTTSSSGNKRGQKEKAEAKSRAVKSQNGLKGSSLSAGKNVLQQNHQKQNCRDHQQSKKARNKIVVDSGSTSKKIRPLSKKPRSLSSHSQGNKQYADSAAKFDVIGGDSLKALLEQKLRKLTSKIESSSSSLIQQESLVESESVSDCTSFYKSQKCKLMQGEEHEVSSISTLTEANDTLSCNESFTDFRQDNEYGIKESSSDK